jgi:hypothetical protein
LELRPSSQHLAHVVWVSNQASGGQLLKKIAAMYLGDLEHAENFALGHFGLRV